MIFAARVYSLLATKPLARWQGLKPVMMSIKACRVDSRIEAEQPLCVLDCLAWHRERHTIGSDAADHEKKIQTRSGKAWLIEQMLFKRVQSSSRGPAPPFFSLPHPAWARITHAQSVKIQIWAAIFCWWTPKFHLEPWSEKSSAAHTTTVIHD